MFIIETFINMNFLSIEMENEIGMIDCLRRDRLEKKKVHFTNARNV